jgi:predicted nucleotidyltransferase
MEISPEKLGGVKQEDAKKIIGIIMAYVPEAKVILFGSRAQNRYGKNSDIDIALDASEPISRSIVHEIKAVLNETSIPLLIDLVDLNSVNVSVQEEIKKYGVLWKS